MQHLKLITEVNDETNVVIEEELSSDNSKKKKYYIEGIFLQGNVRNRNGRYYPIDLLNREVARYIKETIDDDRAIGELGHPKIPNLNFERASHKIISLKRSGNNYIGKARIMENVPLGKIAKGLIQEGVKLGVSSRGLGKLRKQNDMDVVEEGFKLLTAADIVYEPSAPEAFVNGIMEGKEWIITDTGITECQIDEAKEVMKKVSKREIEDKFLSVFESFIYSL